MSEPKTHTWKGILASIAIGSVIGTVGLLGYKAISTPDLQELTNEQKIALINAAKRSSVMVIASHNSGGAKGSGVVIKRLGDKAIVITNGHVVLSNGSLAQNVVVKSLGAKKFISADVIYANQSPEVNLDIALLVVDDPKNELGQEVKFASEAKEGQFVVSVGSPLNEEFTTDDGYIKYVKADAVGTIVAHDALIEHGSSGGGLFNANGELVGINTYILDDKKTGVALYSERFLANMKLYSVKVEANSDWQNSGISINQNNRIMVVLARGKWSVSSWVDGLDAMGTNEYAEYSLTQEYPHGSLLMSYDGGGTAVAIDKWWNGVERNTQTVLQTNLEGKSATLSFRVNDKDTRNNTGQLDVTVLVW